MVQHCGSIKYFAPEGCKTLINDIFEAIAIINIGISDSNLGCSCQNSNDCVGVLCCQLAHVLGFVDSYQKCFSGSWKSKHLMREITT